MAQQQDNCLCVCVGGWVGLWLSIDRHLQWLPACWLPAPLANQITSYTAANSVTFSHRWPWWPALFRGCFSQKQWPILLIARRMYNTLGPMLLFPGPLVIRCVRPARDILLNFILLPHNLTGLLCGQRDYHWWPIFEDGLGESGRPSNGRSEQNQGHCSTIYGNLSVNSPNCYRHQQNVLARLRSSFHQRYKLVCEWWPVWPLWEWWAWTGVSGALFYGDIKPWCIHTCRRPTRLLSTAGCYKEFPGNARK